jgi:formyl-CoA transferase
MVAGATAGMIMADFGAEVVKVEQPRVGDPLRQWTSAGQPLWWQVYGRNKRYVTLDLKSEQGRGLVQRLVPSFDIVIESFVPGTLEKLGLGWNDLQALHPRLILLRISGWGQTGPLARRPGSAPLSKPRPGLPP